MRKVRSIKTVKTIGWKTYVAGILAVAFYIWNVTHGHEIVAFTAKYLDRFSH